jgi:hypothetical protein
MPSLNGARRAASFVGPPVAAVLIVFFIYVLPREVVTVLVAWTLGSFPIGVLIGHCALSEQQQQRGVGCGPITALNHRRQGSRLDQ